MIKTLSAILTAAVILLVAGLLLLPSPSLHPTAPHLATQALPPLEAQASTVTLPITIPHASIAQALEAATPASIADESRVFGKTVRWSVARGPFRAAGRSGRLGIGSKLHGKVKRKSRTLATLSGRMHLGMQPRLTPHWRLIPNLSPHVKLDHATVFFLFNIAGLVEPLLNAELAEVQARAAQEIEEDDFLEREARKQFDQLCRSFQLRESPPLWLEAKPTGVHAAQPHIGPDNIRLQFGFDVETRILAHATQPQCPFPAQLELVDPEPGRFDFALPAEFSYDAIAEAVQHELIGNTYGDALRIDAIRIRPHGQALLIAADISMAAGGWLKMDTEGTLYLLAKPQLDIKRQAIAFTNVEMDLASRDALAEIAAAAAEPVLVRLLSDRMLLHLEPVLQKIGAQAQKALADLSSEKFQIKGQIQKTQLSRMDVGPQTLRLAFRIQGDVQASALQLPWPDPQAEKREQKEAEAQKQELQTPSEAKRKTVAKQRVRKAWNRDRRGRRDGELPELHRAARRGDSDRVQELIRAGADVNARDEQRHLPPLIYAIKDGHEEVVRELLDAGAEVNVHGPSGWTPLLGASDEGHETIARWLLERGADPNAADGDGDTPLFKAVAEDHPEVVRLLIEYGADVHQIDAHGGTLLDLARNHAEISRMLREAGVRE